MSMKSRTCLKDGFIKGFIVACVVDIYISLLYFICKPKCNVVVHGLTCSKLSSFLFRAQNLLTVHQKKAVKTALYSSIKQYCLSLSSLHPLKLFSCILHLLSLFFSLSDCCLLEWDSFTSPSKECHIFGSPGGICNLLVRLYFFNAFCLLLSKLEIFGEKDFHCFFMKLDDAHSIESLNRSQIRAVRGKKIPSISNLSENSRQSPVHCSVLNTFLISFSW